MNLFKQLKRGNPLEENFFSSSLAIILDEVPDLTYFLIKKILNEDMEGNDYEIVLEDTFNDGRFDLVIKSIGIEIYFENKISSSLGEGQIEKYAKYLKQKKEKTKLILLTRDYENNKNIYTCTNNYIFWSQLYDFIEEFLKDHIDHIGERKVYLLTEFLDFLKDEHMSNEKVTWEYKEGLNSFFNLLNILQSVLYEIKKDGLIKEYGKKGIGQDYAGFWLNKKDFWVGVIYSDPEKIFFEFYDWYIKKVGNKKIFDEMEKSPDEHPSKYLDFNKTYFLAFTKEDQKKAIYDFIKDMLIFTQNLEKK
jgi:hypothetical protein